MALVRSVTVQKEPGGKLGATLEGTMLKSARQDGPLGLAGGGKLTGWHVVRVNGKRASTAADVGRIAGPAAEVRLEFQQKRTQLQYSSVIDAAAALPRAERVRVLARATGRAKAGAERAVAAAPRASLLELKRAADAAAPAQRAGVGGAAERRVSPDGAAYTKKEFVDFFGGSAEWDAAGPARPVLHPSLSYVDATPSARTAGLSRMLVEAAARSVAQVEFEAKIAAETPAKKCKKKGKVKGKSWACAACLAGGLHISKVVICPQYNDICVYCSIPGEKEQHVYCCSCLRAYLLGSRLHQGDLSKMVCPACEDSARASMTVSTGSLGKKYHDSGDSKWLLKLPKSDVCRVIGPLDELRMHDLRVRSARKVAVPAAVREALRGCEAKACPHCGSYCEHAGGCDAVICGNCTRIFDWKRAT